MDYSDFLREWHNQEEFVVCHTSGSTGQPKILNLPKREMERSADRTIRFFGLQPGAVLYSCISPDFIGGKMVAVRALRLGYDGMNIEGNTRFHYETPSNRPLSACKLPRIDMISVVPSQMRHILDHLEEMPEFGAILIGGSSIPAQLRREIEKSGLQAWESYGMTETASHIAVRRVRENPDPFMPLDGIGVSLQDDCLRIEIPGWQTLQTNDLAELTPKGGFRILGRRDNMIISGGKKINPERVEEMLEGVFPFPIAISSREDPKWGERVVIVIETTDYTANMPSDEIIIEKCKMMLPGFMTPKEVARGVIPRSENGKILRESLKSIVNYKK